MRNFHELYSRSLVRLMKRSTFGLDSLATVCLLRVFKPGLKSNFYRYHPLKNSLFKQEMIGNFFNWDFTQSTPFPPSIQLYPQKYSTTVITWLIWSNHKFQKLFSFFLGGIDYQPLFGKWARAPPPDRLSLRLFLGRTERRKWSLLFGFWTFLI